MTSTDQRVAARATGRIAALRTTSFAAVVMILLVLVFGMVVNLYAKLPASDEGRDLFAAFGAAVSAGPVPLAVHAVLGTLLVLTSFGAVWRAVLTRRAGLIVIAGVALLAVLMAWFSGTGFVGHQGNAASFSMALATAVAALCYATVLFVTPAVATTKRSAGGA
ncbi:hypothetical protein [Specibacter cremeus]|uniref:hypothetical protein n=1 Tax=Specibacter cremeus TaxID=1629051 RepID=UPI000F7739BC|nr:hypothetical protein [Specibacter cremeus]